MNTFTLTMAFLMGLTGSLHCAGMCGPIMWIMPFHTFGGLKKWAAISLYHIGRISVYALLALVLHSFRYLFRPEWQQYFSIGAGSLLLIAGVVSFVPAARVRSLPWAGTVQKGFSYFLIRPGLSTLFAAGLLNGLLPCGMVYMALSATMMVKSSADAILTMYAFGIGTIPMLVSIVVLRSKTAFIKVAHFRNIVPMAMFIFGSLFVLRGMNLGIPYLSPKVTVEQHTIKACCCHKHNG